MGAEETADGLCVFVFFLQKLKFNSVNVEKKKKDFISYWLIHFVVS